MDTFIVQGGKWYKYSNSTPFSHKTSFFSDPKWKCVHCATIPKNKLASICPPEARCGIKVDFPPNPPLQLPYRNCSLAQAGRTSSHPIKRQIVAQASSDKTDFLLSYYSVNCSFGGTSILAVQVQPLDSCWMSVCLSVCLLVSLYKTLYITEEMLAFATGVPYTFQCTVQSSCLKIFSPLCQNTMIFKKFFVF